MACPSMWRNDSPLGLRLASEKGSDTHTMNMNAGWIRSQGEAPTQGTWSSDQATHCANVLSKVRATCGIRMISEAMNSMVKPRKTSSEVRRPEPGGGAAVPGTAMEARAGA